MKKFICGFLMTLMSVFAMTSKAQTVENSRFFDNWAATLKGGGTTPLNHHAFWGDMRSVVGLEFVKDVTPILSLGVEGEWTINTSRVLYGISNHLTFDRQYVGALGKINLMNAFGGYLGTPRLFEIAVVAGCGWQHDYFKGHYPNDLYAKFGIDFDFNLGKSKIWSLSFKPDIVFNTTSNDLNFNLNRAMLELQAGITYHFINSNDTHSFVLCNKKYTQKQWNELNREVNDLRKSLRECQNRPVEVVRDTVFVEKIVVAVTDEKVAPIEVQFAQNSAVVNSTMTDTLKEFANMVKDTDKKIVVKGFASVEGAETYNKVLSTKRANAVKDILIKNGVCSDNVEATGCGETTEFGKTLKANRVVVVSE